MRSIEWKEHLLTCLLERVPVCLLASATSTSRVSDIKNVGKQTTAILGIGISWCSWIMVFMHRLMRKICVCQGDLQLTVVKELDIAGMTCQSLFTTRVAAIVCEEQLITSTSWTYRDESRQNASCNAGATVSTCTAHNDRLTCNSTTWKKRGMLHVHSLNLNFVTAMVHIAARPRSNTLASEGSCQRRCHIIRQWPWRCTSHRQIEKAEQNINDSPKSHLLNVPFVGNWWGKADRCGR